MYKRKKKLLNYSIIQLPQAIRQSPFDKFPSTIKQ